MILYQTIIMRADLRRNPQALYVFGDNLARVGMGGQAKEMRGAPNALSIPTKRNPRLFFVDSDLAEVRPVLDAAAERLCDHDLAGGVVVFPTDGVGTGLANLHTHAPLIWDYLCNLLAAVGIRNGG